MLQTNESAAHGTVPRGVWGRWTAAPLYFRILLALALGLVTGVVLGQHAAVLATPAKLILRLLSAIAPPLILLAILRALVNAELPRGTGPRIAWLLVLNSSMAIVIGLTVANLMQPGTWHTVGPTPPASAAKNVLNPLEQFLDNVPRSLLGPLTDNGNVIGVITAKLDAPPPRGSCLKVPLTVEKDGHFSVPVRFHDGKRRQVLVDTGYDGVLLLSPPLVEELGMQAHAARGVQVRAIGPGAATTGTLFVLPGMELAGCEFTDVEAWTGGTSSGTTLLGSGFLRRFRATFDFQRLILWLEVP